MELTNQHAENKMDEKVSKKQQNFVRNTAVKWHV